MAYKVIDVSFFQGLNINWQAVKDSGVEGAVIRCGQMEKGIPSPDSTFETNYTNIKNVNLHLGSYYTSGALSLEDAQREANFFVSQLQGKSFDLPVYVDLEDDGDTSFLHANTNTVIQIFKDTLEGAGYKFGIYANYNWFTNYIDIERWKDLPLWLAQYEVDQVTFQPNYFGMWQKTEKGQISGVEGNVDVNELYIQYWDRTINPITPVDTLSVIDIGVEYEVFIEGRGWSPTSRNGFLAGTIGQSLRLEKVRIRLTNVNGRDIHIAYKLHIQDIGWTEYVYDGAECGCYGKRIEGIQINLIGSYADQLDVNFRSHVQNEGDLNWAKDGELSGTEGGELRLEAFAVIVVAQGVDLSLDESESFKHIVKKAVEEIINLPSYNPVDNNDGYGKYFTPEEFSCDCVKGYDIPNPCNGYTATQYGTDPNLSPRLLEVLNAVREALGLPIIITCGTRCTSSNNFWGGVPDSCHRFGDAIDCYCAGMDIVEFAFYIANNYPDIGCRVYPNQGFLHIEVNTSLSGVFNQESYYMM